jgi:large subunit ribosomal protein L21e
VGNSAQQKGLPYKYYHGKTGIVFNITKSAVGVLVQKIVGNRYIEKRLHVRVEHVRHSRYREGTGTVEKDIVDSIVDFLKRVKENTEKRRNAKANGSMSLDLLC